MKRIIYLLSSLALGLLMASCYKTDNDNFDASSSERAEAELMRCKKILSDAPYGWIMEYYPEKEERTMGGVMFCCRFSGDTAYLSMERNVESDQKKYPAGEEVVSLFQLKVEQGIVLSFNTFNPLLHQFGEPHNAGYANVDVDGYAGDYEFVIREATAASLTMTGKKWKNTCMLTRLEEKGSDYLAAVRNMDSVVNALGDGMVKLKTAQGMYPVTLGTSFGGRTLSVTFRGSDGSDSVVSAAWICTPQAMKLYEPVDIEGVKVTEFVADKAGSSLGTPDGKMTFVGPTSLFEKAFYLEHTFLPELMNDNLMAVYEEAVEKNTAEYGEEVEGLFVGKNHLFPVNDKYPQAMVVISGGYHIAFGLQMTAVEGNDAAVSLKYLGQGFNASFYAWFEVWVKYICEHSPYTLTEEGENICWRSGDGEVVFYTQPVR